MKNFPYYTIKPIFENADYLSDDAIKYDGKKFITFSADAMTYGGEAPEIFHDIAKTAKKQRILGNKKDFTNIFWNLEAVLNLNDLTCIVGKYESNEKWYEIYLEWDRLTLEFSKFEIRKVQMDS